MALTAEQLAVLDGMDDVKIIIIWEDLFAPIRGHRQGMDPQAYCFAMRPEFREVNRDEVRAHMESRPVVADWIRDRDTPISELIAREKSVR